MFRTTVGFRYDTNAAPPNVRKAKLARGSGLAPGDPERTRWTKEIWTNDAHEAGDWPLDRSRCVSLVLSMTTATEISRVTVHGQELRVQIRRGDGTGRPLLMCNGMGDGLDFLQPLVDSLDPGVELIRFDVPGVGGSPVALLPYAFPTLAWLATRMLDELGYRGQVDVLGYSWGGALAQQLAVQHPRRCRRLILTSTSSGILSVPGRPLTLQGMLRPQSAHRGRPLATTAGVGYLYQLAAIATWTSLPFLSMIRQPTLVIGSDEDRVAPAANSRILASLIPNSILRIVHGGHSSIVTEAPEIGLMISQFLR